MNEPTMPSSPLLESMSEFKVMVLLVDDQPIVGEAIRRQLADHSDVDFHYCSDAAAAVQLACEIRPTVILQDLIMPNVDGLALVRRFRQQAETKNIPIIVLSTKEDPEVKSQSFSAGANDYLVKLPDKIELIARIHYHSRSYLNQIERDEAYRALRQSQRQLVDNNIALTQFAEKLRDTNNALGAAEQLARVGSWTWDVARDSAVWSAMLYEIFLWNVSKPPPTFEEHRRLFTGESFAVLRHAVKLCIDQGDSYSLELEAVRTNGELFHVNAKGQAARNIAGKIVSIFGTIQDITEHRKLSEIARRSAILEERTRIAGEIHDSLGQAFAAIVLQMEIAEERLGEFNRDQLKESISKAREFARMGLVEARRSALTLRPCHVLEGGLLHAIEQLAQRTSVNDVLACEVKLDGIPRQLDPLVEHELFRITQEALNNAIRHAKPTRITVSLNFSTDAAILIIADNGVGLAADVVSTSDGYGLVTMRERANKISATFHLQSKPGHGTSIEVRVHDKPHQPEIKS